MMRVGMIDFYLDEWHANHYPKWIADVSEGQAAVTSAFGLIDPPGKRTNARWCEEMGIERMKSMEDVAEGSDALIVLSPDNCEMHEALCQIPLRSGKPTYVDKTFAPDAEIAGRIFAVAHAHNTPCFSTSALRYAAEYKGIQGVKTIASWGPGRFENYAIHQLEPIIMLMQARVSRVLSLSGGASSVTLLQMEDGRVASLTCMEATSGFMMNIMAQSGNSIATVSSDFFRALIEQMIAFFRTGAPPVTCEETLGAIAAYAAGMRSLDRPGKWIDAYA